LIRRSGAAAPLLNAARERGGIRSAIERLKGGSASETATPAAETEAQQQQ
jgi:hypothetical protein